MNNLMRTLTASQVESSPDLKLLLSTVKEGRRQGHEPKLSDPFYDSLEGLLVDLRTVTMDNHDADAFLKPVSKTDYPDYFDVISNPMDMQTMLKKVKQKQYKSKREFKDDLDLIWSNCYTYNATENHPLRQCAKRLKMKADKLLKNITDRKERTDPSIPSSLSPTSPRTKLKSNGTSINGHTHRSVSVLSKHSSPGKPSHRRRLFKLDAPFADTPAISRSADGMSTFAVLDKELSGQTEAEAPKYGLSSLDERLREYAVVEDFESESESGSEAGSPMSVDGSAVGEKRKLNGVDHHHPRKRVRVTQAMVEDKDAVALWWDAVRSDSLLANGLPCIPCTSSQDPQPRTPPSKKSKPKTKPKSRRRKKPSSSRTKPPVKSILALMNNNIGTMKRVRRTHAKFADLNRSNSNNEDAGESPGPVEVPGEEYVGSMDADIVIDERPWKPPGSGIEIGEANAEACLDWMTGKVLEHAGFQGATKSALDVLAGVTSEYLLNVGRTIGFLSDKFANQMTPEEIILHTLFESGTTKIQDLERYIKDDVVRYGSRLGDLEKKLVGAYREATAVEALDDDALFGADEDEEEDGAFVMGNFADALGDDFLGLRELGIADEFGMSSLSVPKKLLKGKNKGGSKLSAAAEQPKEPPLPYPPPPPFVPVDSKNVEHQIGLLKPYYQERLSMFSATAPIPPVLPPFSLSNLSTTSPDQTSPADTTPPVVLPDDSPDPAHVKIGPLAQITRVPPGGASKKKAKAKDPVAPVGYVPSAVSLTEPTLSGGLSVASSEGPKPKKSSAGGGKKVKGEERLPPVVAASA